MAVTVTPEQFALVDFEVSRIASVVEMLLPRVGLPEDADVRIEVNETTPMGRVRLVTIDPITITAESGALEDPKAPRQLSEPGTAEALGRMLLMARDRLDHSFGAPAIDDEIPGGVAMAWDVYCVSRLGRAGYPVTRQRRLYHFRNRFGFTDLADAAFDRLWGADALTYADLVQIASDAVSGESAVGVAAQR
jgi:hypothetical protein